MISLSKLENLNKLPHIKAILKGKSVVFRNEVLPNIYSKKKDLRKTLTSLRTCFPTVIYLFILCRKKDQMRGKIKVIKVFKYSNSMRSVNRMLNISANGLSCKLVI